MKYDVYYWWNGRLRYDRSYKQLAALRRYLNHPLCKGFLVRCDLQTGQIDWYQYSATSASGLGYCQTQQLDEYLEVRYESYCD